MDHTSKLRELKVELVDDFYLFSSELGNDNEIKETNLFQSSFIELEDSKQEGNDRGKEVLVTTSNWQDLPYKKNKFDSKETIGGKFGEANEKALQITAKVSSKAYNVTEQLPSNTLAGSNNSILRKTTSSMRAEVAREKHTVKEIQPHSLLAGLKGSVLNDYRKLYSTECKQGSSCLRHADIPGLSKSLKFTLSQCSTLKLETTESTKNARAEIRVNYTSKHLHDVQRVNATRAPYRNMHSETAHRQFQSKTGSVEHITSSKGISSTLSIKRKYDGDKHLIDSVTPLLHAQAFDKIVSIVDAHLKSKSDGEALIPPLFVVGLSHFKLANYSDAKGRLLRCDKINQGTVHFAICILEMSNFHLEISLKLPVTTRMLLADILVTQWQLCFAWCLHLSLLFMPSMALLSEMLLK